MRQSLKPWALALLLLAYLPSLYASTVTYQYREILPANTPAGDPVHISGQILIDDAYWPDRIQVGPGDQVGVYPGFSVYRGIRRLAMTFTGAELGSITLSTFLCSQLLPEFCEPVGLPPDTLLFGIGCCGTHPRPTFDLSFSGGFMSGSMAFSGTTNGNELSYFASGGPIWTTDFLSAFGPCRPNSLGACSGGSGRWERVVSEPGSLALISIGIFALGTRRQQRRPR